MIGSWERSPKYGSGAEPWQGLGTANHGGSGTLPLTYTLYVHLYRDTFTTIQTSKYSDLIIFTADRSAVRVVQRSSYEGVTVGVTVQGNL